MSSTKSTLVAVVIGLLCLACSREQDELCQDPYADPDVKVGQQSSEQFEPADKHEGRYSVRKYEFKGKGPAHKMSEVRKYGLDHTGRSEHAGNQRRGEMDVACVFDPSRMLWYAVCIYQVGRTGSF